MNAAIITRGYERWWGLIENISRGLQRSVLHKSILIQYIFPIKLENLSLIIYPEEKMGKNDRDVFKTVETAEKR